MSTVSRLGFFVVSCQLIIYVHIQHLSLYHFQVYDMVTSISKLSHVLEDALREYNETNATMDLGT